MISTLALFGAAVAVLSCLKEWCVLHLGLMKEAGLTMSKYIKEAEATKMMDRVSDAKSRAWCWGNMTPGMWLSIIVVTKCQLMRRHYHPKPCHKAHGCTGLC
jgi:hypothetical protein